MFRYNCFSALMHSRGFAMEESVDPLRQALAHSPDNIPLRRHLAATLQSLGRLAEAETEFRELLRRQPDDLPLRISLAMVYYQAEKYSQSMVIVEDLLKRSDTPAAVMVIHARLLARAGEVERAVRQYRDAVRQEPEAADTEFADSLGIGAEEDEELSDGRLRWNDDPEGPSFPMEKPDQTFADVGGMESVKEEIRVKIIMPLTHADIYKAYGKKAGGGILMYGPPGCGKTHLARATAGEVNAAFLAIGIHDVLEMWIGNSERNLHAIFEQARGNRPSVLFFDEVDALAANRSEMRGTGGRMAINQFLNELDGVKTSNEGILILAATNAPWHLDPAFRRPGRFDRVLFIPPPDAPARASILRLLCKGKPQKDIDYDTLAKKSEQFSGADLKGAIDLAIEGKLQEAARTGTIPPLTTKDILAAIGRMKPSTREWFATAKNYAIFSNQGGMYDDVAKYMKL